MAIETYTELQAAYDHFNEQLFNAELPDCLFTLQRQKRTYGYFSKERFANREGTRLDEIAMNPEYFGIRSVKDVLSTLVHEMCHLWQNHFGTPGRRGYHNKEWAEKMDEVGLTPTDTGEPGGKRVGDRMTHMIERRGKFDLICEELLTRDFLITWLDRFPPLTKESLSGIDDEIIKVLGLDELEGDEGIGEPKKQTRIKYEHECNEGIVRVWGGKSLNIKCGDCEKEFYAVE